MRAEACFSVCLSLQVPLAQTLEARTEGEGPFRPFLTLYSLLPQEYVRASQPPLRTFHVSDVPFKCLAGLLFVPSVITALAAAVINTPGTGVCPGRELQVRSSSDDTP